MLILRVAKVLPFREKCQIVTSFLQAIYFVTILNGKFNRILRLFRFRIDYVCLPEIKIGED